MHRPENRWRFQAFAPGASGHAGLHELHVPGRKVMAAHPPIAGLQSRHDALQLFEIPLGGELFSGVRANFIKFP
jgi:hypothetical protein